MADKDATMELWKNNGGGNVVVQKIGQYGVTIEEFIPGGRSLHITKDDRKMNQEQAATPELDVFTNGMLTPVRILDEESAAEFASNPNLLTEKEMIAIVKGSQKGFDAKLEEIANPVVVRRMLSIARDQDVPVKRVEALEARLEAMQEVPTTKRTSRIPEGGLPEPGIPVTIA